MMYGLKNGVMVASILIFSFSVCSLTSAGEKDRKLGAVVVKSSGHEMDSELATAEAVLSGTTLKIFLNAKEHWAKYGDSFICLPMTVRYFDEDGNYLGRFTTSEAFMPDWAFVGIKPGGYYSDAMGILSPTGRSGRYKVESFNPNTPLSYKINARDAAFVRIIEISFNEINFSKWRKPTSSTTTGTAAAVPAPTAAVSQDDRPALIRRMNLSPTERYVKQPNEKSTWMHYAADRNDIPAMEWLLKHGWTVDLLDKGGATPLHHAAAAGSLEAMKWLDANGASLRETDNSGDTLIFAAVMSDNVEVLTWLEQTIMDVDERNDQGQTPAHYAALYGSLNALKWLKNNGAKLDVKDEFGETPLDSAKRMDKAEAAKWLEENGGK